MTNNEWGFITLPTHADPEQRAIARLKIASKMSLEHYKTPLLLTHSGGKDSCVLTELALRAEIPFEVMHAHTTADAPETVHFVRNEFARLENRGIRCSINYPLYSAAAHGQYDFEENAPHARAINNGRFNIGIVDCHHLLPHHKNGKSIKQLQQHKRI